MSMYISNRISPILQDPNDLGTFTDLAALQAAFPIGNPGDTAITTVDETMYTWDDDTTSWVKIGSSGLKNIVEDTTPQLGGELDVNGKAISETGANLTIKTITSGDILLSPVGNVIVDGDLTADKVIGTAAGGGSVSALRAVSTGPSIEIRETDATLDNKSWDFIAGSEQLSFRIVKDDNTSANSWLEINRTGITVDTIAFPNGKVGIGVVPIAQFEITSSNANAVRINPFGTVAGNTGEIQFVELVASGTNYVGFKAADAITANVVWTLPNADGTADQFLQTDGSKNLTWADAAGGITWEEVTTTTKQGVIDTGYVTNNVALVTVTLPDTAVLGSVIRIAGNGTGGWKLAQNAGETIHFDNVDTTTGTGGSLASSNRYDAIELVNITANTDWSVISSVGNITII